MNILSINTHYMGGGAEAVMRMITDGLKKRGHEISIFTGDAVYVNENVSPIDLSVFRRKLSIKISNDIDISQSDKIMLTPEFKRADVIHCHNLHGWYFNLNTLRKMSLIKPVIWTLHDMWAITPHCAHTSNYKSSNGFFECSDRSIYPGTYWPNAKYLCYRKEYIYKRSKFTLVVPSQWLKNLVNQSVLADKPIELISNGIDTSIFKVTDKVSARQLLGIPLDKKVILFVANGGKNNMFKGWQYANSVLSKFADNKNILGICVGGEENIITENMYYVSKVNSQHKLALYYSSCDVLLFTSISENMPLVVLEASSCGVPVVSFDVGGVREIIDYTGNGYLARHKSVEDLYQGVKHFLSMSEDTRKVVGKNSANKVSQIFGVDTMVEKYISLYVNLIS
ncbi:MAG: glycosyltransferase [Patescibacteria group bacterium]|nr:glycosyltransferase [Patescibacteria group bacterium]